MAHIFGDSLGDKTADTIRSALVSAGDTGMVRQEISAVFNRNLSSTELDRGLEVLLDAGLATCETEASGGRPRERWKAKADSSFTSYFSTLFVNIVNMGEKSSLNDCNQSKLSQKTGVFTSLTREYELNELNEVSPDCENTPQDYEENEVSPEAKATKTKEATPWG